MSEVINAILSFITATFCIVYLVVTLKANKKGEFYTQKNIKFRAIASIVLLLLFCFEVVASGISLTKSVFIMGLDIICTVLWAISLGLNFLSFLKKPKDETTEESDKSKETENE